LLLNGCNGFSIKRIIRGHFTVFPALNGKQAVRVQIGKS
jgi:hypothetical protein